MLLWQWEKIQEMLWLMNYEKEIMERAIEEADQAMKVVGWVIAAIVIIPILYLLFGLPL